MATHRETGDASIQEVATEGNWAVAIQSGLISEHSVPEDDTNAVLRPP